MRNFIPEIQDHCKLLFSVCISKDPPKKKIVLSQLTFASNKIHDPKIVEKLVLFLNSFFVPMFVSSSQHQKTILIIGFFIDLLDQGILFCGQDRTTFENDIFKCYIRSTLVSNSYIIANFTNFEIKDSIFDIPSKNHDYITLAKSMYHTESCIINFEKTFNRPFPLDVFRNFSLLREIYYKSCLEIIVPKNTISGIDTNTKVYVISRQDLLNIILNFYQIDQNDDLYIYISHLHSSYKNTDDLIQHIIQRRG